MFGRKIKVKILDGFESTIVPLLCQKIKANQGVMMMKLLGFTRRGNNKTLLRIIGTPG